MINIRSILTAGLVALGTAHGATFPVITAFTNSTAYTNATSGHQTIVRVTVATPMAVSNQVFIKYTQGLGTNAGFTSVATTNFRAALWPGATSEVAVALYPLDRILISQTYTGNTYATYDVLQTSGGGGGAGTGFPLTTNAAAGGFGVNGFSYLGSDSITARTGRITQDFAVDSLTLGSEAPISTFNELADELGLRGYVSVASYSSSLSGTPYPLGAAVSISEGAAADGGTTITLGRNIFVGQGGITVSNSLLYPHVIIITGDPTNSLEAMFPPQTSNVTRIYMRLASSAPPYNMDYIDIDPTTSGYIRIIGSTNSASLAVEETITATASNATLFAGHNQHYFMNFANITNFQAWDDGSQTIIQTSFHGIEAGDGANFSAVVRTNGTTNLVLRLDVASGIGTGSCLTCSNEWTEAQTYSGNAVLRYNNTRVYVTGSGNSNTGVLYATIPISGTGNVAMANYATVAGGRNNTASGVDSTVAGGSRNTSTGSMSTVVGGYGNTAYGNMATVMGGSMNHADGIGSIAAGYQTTAGGDYSDTAGQYVSTDADADYSFLRGLFATSTNEWTYAVMEGTASTNKAETKKPYTIVFYTLTTNQFKLGVGTNDPIAGLDVHGGFNFTGPITSNGAPFYIPANTTNAIYEIVTTGDGVTSNPRRVVFRAGSGSSPTSTVSGTTTIVWLASSSSGGGTITNAISTNSFMTAIVSGSSIVIGATKTPLFVGDLDDYATGAENTNIASRVSESYGFITTNGAQTLANSANAVSIQGQSWSATAPTNSGAYPIWNGSSWVFESTPPASSTGAVSSINLKTGSLTFNGYVTNAGSTFTVLGDGSPSATAADSTSNNIFTAHQVVQAGSNSFVQIGNNQPMTIGSTYHTHPALIVGSSNQPSAAWDNYSGTRIALFDPRGANTPASESLDITTLNVGSAGIISTIGQGAWLNADPGLCVSTGVASSTWSPFGMAWHNSGTRWYGWIYGQNITRGSAASMSQTARPLVFDPQTTNLVINYGTNGMWSGLKLRGPAQGESNALFEVNTRGNVINAYGNRLIESPAPGIFVFMLSSNEYLMGTGTGKIAVVSINPPTTNYYP